MKPTARLKELGQSLWLDNITRDLLTSGTLRRYLDEFSVTGLTSNPTIYRRAVNDLMEVIASKSTDLKATRQWPVLWGAKG